MKLPATVLSAALTVAGQLCGPEARTAYVTEGDSKKSPKAFTLDDEPEVMRRAVRQTRGRRE